MKKPWRVRYQTGFMRKPHVRFFSSEIQARRFYKKTWNMPYFQTASIFHLVDDSVRLIVCRVTAEIIELPQFQRIWKKLPSKTKKKIQKRQEIAIRNALQEMGQQT